MVVVDIIDLKEELEDQASGEEKEELTLGWKSREDFMRRIYQKWVFCALGGRNQKVVRGM